jgi:competence protein ComEC
MVSTSSTKRSAPIKFSKRRQKILGGLILFLVIFFSLGWQANYVGWFSRSLRVWVFDVGQGDAIFIETPDGQQILVDAGTSDNKILTKLGQVMLPWDRSIDAVVVTHPHLDHEGGLVAVLQNYQMGTIYETGVLGYDEMQDTVRELVAEQETRIVLLDGSNPPLPLGEGWGEGLVVQILSPDSNLQNKKIDNLNNSSVVLLLTYGDTSLLLTGDAAFGEESEILNNILGPIDVLKVAHHGSLTSTSQQFLSAVAPRYAIISVGENNDYGHPAVAALERLFNRRIQIFRTDLDGDILITSNGFEPNITSHPLPF